MRRQEIHKYAPLMYNFLSLFGTCS